MFPALWAAFADDPEACVVMRKGLEFETALAADKARATAGRDAARAIIMGDRSARNEVLRDGGPSFIDHAELWRCYGIDEAAMLSRRKPGNT